MNLYESWIAHLKSHATALVECEICLRGDYKDPHACIFVNQNPTSKNCEDVLIEGLEEQRFDLKNLMESQVKVSLQGNSNNDAHFFYFASLLLNEEALLVAREVRFSTTNRYSTAVPGEKIINKYRIPIPSGGLFRGIRIDETNYNRYCNLEKGEELPLSNYVMSMTELFGRGLDYSIRKRPLDPPAVDFGILLELKNFKGLPIAALSTYPVEREWRVLGKFFVDEVIQDVQPSLLHETSADWVLTNWAKPVEHVSNWCLIRLHGEQFV